MSYYEIERACGHTEEVNITGTNVRGERDRRAAYLATLDCFGCYRSKQAAQRSETTGAWVDPDSLPVLRGSERQVEWADRIRVDGIAAIVRDVTDPPAGPGKLVRAVETGHLAVAFGPALEQLDEQDRATVAHLLIAAAVRQIDARWWIDNRDHITGSALDVLTGEEHAKLARLLGHP